MSLTSPPNPDHPREPIHAFSAAREMLDADADELPTIDTESEESPDPGDEYALQFLTYAYTVPFRLIAVQQELSDVFGFEGDFDSDFISRWESLSSPEQAAFSQSYREYRRMQALGRAFSSADRSDDAEANVQERAGRFVAAHMNGLEQWQDNLRGEAATTASRMGLPAENIAIPANASGYTAARESSGGNDRKDFLGDLDRQAGLDLAAMEQHLAPIDDLAHAVLEKLVDTEMAEARRRFLIRVRWMLSLPNQQRMAIALRTTGRKRREIAAAMGISEESVKTHLSRADDDWNKLQAEAASSGAKGNRAGNRS